MLADLRFVLRTLARARGVTVAAVLTVALGLGANILVFSTIDRLLFRPLPYTEPGRLAQVHLRDAKLPDWVSPFRSATLPFEIMHALTDETDLFEGVARMSPPSSGPGTRPATHDEPLFIGGASSNAFNVLGVHPVIGRSFVEADGAVPGDIAVMLTEETWKGRYGASTDVLAMQWREGVLRYRVVGVLPAGFLLPSSLLREQRFDGVCACEPVRLDHPLINPAVPDQGGGIVAPFVRLRPGMSFEAAQAAVDRLVATHTWSAVTTRVIQQGARVTVQPLQAGISMFVRPYLWLISAALWAVLAMTCVNLMVLLVAWGRARRPEAAVRAAIGAPISRLVRVAVLEALVVCAAGGLLAWIVGLWFAPFVLSVVPPALQIFAVGPSDLRIIGLAVAATVVCALVASVVPALRVSRVDASLVLRSGVRDDREGTLSGGRALLAVEAAFGALLMVGAAGTVPGFVSLLLQSPGFEAKNLFHVTVNHNWSTDGLPVRGNAPERVRAILDVVAKVPHVAEVAAALTMPFGSLGGDEDFWDQHGIAGVTIPSSAGVFQTLRTPIVAGRGMSEREVDTRAMVALLNERGASALWPGASADSVVGRTIETIDGIRRIVGVAGDIQSHPGVSAIPIVFLPITAHEAYATQSGLPILVRMDDGRRPDGALIAAALNGVFPRDTVQVQSVADQMASFVAQPRFLAVLFGMLAGIAVVLAIAGLYAMATFEVHRRRDEIGVRLALGASPRDVQAYLLRVTTLPSLLGTAAGLTIGWLVVRATRAAVYGIEAQGFDVYATAGVLMVATAVVAVWRPARRAGRIDPVEVLRSH